ncbi:non-specific lipid transfer protein GPI-anchored 14-like [Typha latifolia]|uniref:non-specific lipid transfer protein GPI-anchored 14-like n=1 Tax=Typha latifolia TaxID=4733 RepID=UPI003C2DEE9B
MAKSSILFLVLALVSASLAFTSTATMGDDDLKDCADQMQNLASCIPYVSGSAEKPTPECCTDTEKVRSAMPKCLCVLIKESTDPSLSLHINTTLALQMPAKCNSDAKVSDCPSILKLPPNSPDAKIFSEGGPSTTAASSSSTVPASSSSGHVSSESTTSSGCKRSQGFAGIGVVGLIVSIGLQFVLELEVGVFLARFVRKWEVMIEVR